MVKSTGIFYFSFLFSTSATAQYWSPLGIGTNGLIVNSIIMDPISGDALIAGNFSLAGGIPCDKIAVWDGSNFASFPNSSPDNPVRIMEFVNDTLYAGGDFTTMGTTSSTCIAKWNGTDWESMGLGFAKTGGHAAVASIYAMAEYNGDLYVAGVFDLADSNVCNFISRWDGSAWQPLGSGINGVNCWVYDMEVFNGQLYVGGSFTTAGGISQTGNIARWNGSSWSSCGGANGSVFDMCIHDGELYVAGAFSSIGGTTLAAKVASYSGATWSAVGSGMDNDVNALASFENNLYAGGIFSTAGGVPASRAAIWDGSGWSPAGSGTNNLIFVLTPDTTRGFLYAGGTFTMADGQSAMHLAKWSNAVGIDSKDPGNSFVVFPNPANNFINLRFEDEIYSLAIMDEKGVIIYEISGPGKEFQIEKGKIPSGYYFFRAEGNKGIISGKLIFCN